MFVYPFWISPRCGIATGTTGFSLGTDYWPGRTKMFSPSLVCEWNRKTWARGLDYGCIQRSIICDGYLQKVCGFLRSDLVRAVKHPVINPNGHIHEADHQAITNWQCMLMEPNLEVLSGSLFWSCMNYLFPVRLWVDVSDGKGNRREFALTNCHRCSLSLSHLLEIRLLLFVRLVLASVRQIRQV